MERGFNRRVMTSILSRTVKGWLASIEDERLRKVCEQDTIVTGGAIVSMLQGEMPNDVDIYFRNISTAIQVAGYYVDKFKLHQSTKGIDCPLYVKVEPDVRGKQRVRIVARSAGIATTDAQAVPEYRYFEADGPNSNASHEFVQAVLNPNHVDAKLVTDRVAAADALDQINEDGDLEEAPDTPDPADKESPPKPKFRPLTLTSNAVTLSDKVQLIIRFYGTPEEIHETYDFVHCMSYYDHANKKLFLDPRAMEAILTKTLIYSGSLYPLATLVRTRKFIQRGWSISAGQYLKMAMQISALNLSDIKVLEDQLVGVDMAYYRHVLTLLADKDPSHVDGAYLVEVVDQVFGNVGNT